MSSENDFTQVPLINATKSENERLYMEIYGYIKEGQISKQLDLEAKTSN